MTSIEVMNFKRFLGLLLIFHCKSFNSSSFILEKNVIFRCWRLTHSIEFFRQVCFSSAAEIV
jgi:hypothetical protein